MSADARTPRGAEVTLAQISDSRAVRVSVQPNSRPDHRTPKGNNPLDPCGLDIHYAVEASGIVRWAFVYLRGFKLDRDGERVPGAGAVSRRLGMVPGPEYRPSYDSGYAVALSDLPEWVADEVREHWPRWSP